MVTNIPTILSDENASAAMKQLANGAWDDIHSIYVVDKEKILKGVMPIHKLVTAKDDESVAGLMDRPKIVVKPETDKEKVAVEALKNDLKSVPVVDDAGHLLGAISTDQIFDILHEEHLEDFLRSSGIRGKGSWIIKLATANLPDLIKSRMPWLVVGLGGGIGASFIISRFQGSLEQNVALAFFISMIAYMSDAIGTQTETIFIRSLTLLKFNIFTYIFREFITGAVIGSIFGVLTGLFAAFLSGSSSIGFVVGLSLFLSMSMATVLACITPIILKALGKDPAVGSGPFTTAVQDFVSLAVYFTIASVVLSKF